MYKKNKYINNIKYFHLFNKSIEGYEIFRFDNLKQRFTQTLSYYKNATKVKSSLSRFLLLNEEYKFDNLLLPQTNNIMRIISWCIMPTHYHLLIKCTGYRELSEMIRLVQDSYTRFYNIKFKRKGPLWQSTYKYVEIERNNELLHVTRYNHLNPTTAGLF